MEPAILLDPVILRDATGTSVNPSTEESNILLRRILKVLESNGVVDNKQRQRIIIDGVGNSSNAASVDTSSFVPILTYGSTTIAGNTVSVVPTIGAPYYNTVWEGPVDQRWRVTEDSHVSYQLGIRNKLSFA